MIGRYVAITEVIWTLAGIPGTIAWIFTFRNAFSAYGAAMSLGKRNERIIAGSLLRLGVYGLLASSGLIFLGLFGMTQPQVVARITPLGWVVTAVLILFGVLTAVSGIDISRTIYTIFRPETEPHPPPDGRSQH